MTPDELWEKYSDVMPRQGGLMGYEQFLAALAEYGQAVRDRDAEICRPRTKRPCDCEICDCGNSGSLQAVTFWDEANYCAAAISREPLP